MKNTILSIGYLFYFVTGITVSFFLACDINEEKGVVPKSIVDPAKYIQYDTFTVDVSIEYKNQNALIDLGYLAGHFESPTSGASCFGICHDISRGGNSMMILPQGGGKQRNVRNQISESYGFSEFMIPVDIPNKKSPQFTDGYKDSLILWEGLRSDHPFELQWEKGSHGHMMRGLQLDLQHEYDALALTFEAYGDSELTDERLGCAISAYEQSIRSSESNRSKGIVTKTKGYNLYESYCADCHETGVKVPTFVMNPLHDSIKTPRLSTFYLSLEEYHTAETTPFYQNRMWKVIKDHKVDIEEYKKIKEITYSMSMNIGSYIKYDMTDYNLQRHESPTKIRYAE